MRLRLLAGLVFAGWLLPASGCCHGFRTVSGTLVDQDGNPLEGATVYVRCDTLHTAGADGRFTIDETEYENNGFSDDACRAELIFVEHPGCEPTAIDVSHVEGDPVVLGTATIDCSPGADTGGATPNCP